MLRIGLRAIKLHCKSCACTCFVLLTPGAAADVTIMPRRCQRPVVSVAHSGTQPVLPQPGDVVTCKARLFVLVL